jgi:hypothetical protein
MASVFIDGINLTKKTNAELAAIVQRLTADPAVKEQFEFVLTFAQNYGSRKQVHNAAVAIDAWKHVNTQTTRIAPSPESLEWSNLEGGHTIHRVPVFVG